MSTSLPKIFDNAVPIDGILGCDILHKFKVFELAKYHSWRLIRLSNGFIPIGLTDKSLQNSDHNTKPVAVSDVNIILNNSIHTIIAYSFQ